MPWLQTRAPSWRTSGSAFSTVAPTISCVSGSTRQKRIIVQRHRNCRLRSFNVNDKVQLIRFGIIVIISYFDSVHSIGRLVVNHAKHQEFHRVILENVQVQNIIGCFIGQEGDNTCGAFCDRDFRFRRNAPNDNKLTFV